MAALRLIIFDFNGVIADDEPAHFLTFQQALEEDDLHLTKEDYYGIYLGMDERNCLDALFRSTAENRDPLRVDRILKRKAALFREYTVMHKPPLFAGAVSLVKQATDRCRLAIASGGRRQQIEFALAGTPIEKDFSVMVSAEDTAIGKPDPGIYQLALKRVNQTERLQPEISPGECLVIEDSLAGIQSALAAGMKAVAVATTYPAAQLAGAHLVLASLEGIFLERLESLFS